ncbi:MAG TPA: divalent-cation tolerance protein CutA [Terriglobia bacterium]|nr:divalent-cation tolerance protein CutA [Terriglobia bacterium]
MTDKVVVMVTAGSLKEARKIALGLVKSGLAACVNLSGPVESVYHWQGKIETSRERLLLVKTSREVFPQVQAVIRKLHSYVTPEIICLPIVDGSRDYLDWLARSIKLMAQPEEPADAPDHDQPAG